jgi:hypothetical protein
MLLGSEESPMKRSTTMFAMLCGFSLVVMCESFAAAGPKAASHPGKPQAHSPAPAAKKAPVQVKGSGKLPANNGAAKSNPTNAQPPAKQANKGASQKPHMENQTTDDDDDDGWDASSDGTPDVGAQGSGGSGGSNPPPQSSQPSGNSRQRTIFGGPPRTSAGQVK